MFANAYSTHDCLIVNPHLINGKKTVCLTYWGICPAVFAKVLHLKIWRSWVEFFFNYKSLMLIWKIEKESRKLEKQLTASVCLLWIVSLVLLDRDGIFLKSLWGVLVRSESLRIFLDLWILFRSSRVAVDFFWIVPCLSKSGDIDCFILDILQCNGCTKQTLLLTATQS